MLPPNKFIIRGLNLDIDNATEELCKKYSESSATTRSILYLLLIVSVISVISVYNSNSRYNWSQDRIDSYSRDIQNYKDTLSKRAIRKSDSVKVASYLADAQKKKELLIANDITNYNVVRFNLIGIVFDINNLASIGGFSLIILLVVLRFTLTREKDNLKIAFNSISERYPDYADLTLFSKDFKSIYDKTYNVNNSTDDVVNGQSELILADINFIRRRYHYNFLSMNEIFHLPYLDLGENKLHDTFIGKIINKYLFYFIPVVYAYILFNDFATLEVAWDLNPIHTVIVELLCVASFAYIYNLSRSCVLQKIRMTKIFSDFKDSQYTYTNSTYKFNKQSVIKKVGIPLLLILLIWLSSMMFNYFFEHISELTLFKR